MEDNTFEVIEYRLFASVYEDTKYHARLVGIFDTYEDVLDSIQHHAMLHTRDGKPWYKNFVINKHTTTTTIEKIEIGEP